MAPVYEELRSLVKTHEQQSAALKVADKAHTAALQQSRHETGEARAEAVTLRQECKRLQALVMSQRDKREKERRTATSTEAELQEQLAEAVRCEAARSAAEVALLKRAAAADVRAARASADAECEAQTSALREMMRLRSAKHALRLKEVIASEEACEAARASTCARLREASLGVLALGVRAARAERWATTRTVEVLTLGAEVEALEEDVAVCEDDAACAAAAHAEASSAAEAEVIALREQIRAVASKQKGWRKALVARHDHEMNSRVRECVASEVARVRDDLFADMEAREAEHQAEVEALVHARDMVATERDELALQLAASRAREEQHRLECEALEKLIDGA